MTLHSAESQEISIGNKIIFRVKNAVYSTLISYAGLRTSLSSGVTIRLDTYADWIIYNEIFVDGEYRKAIDLAFSKLQLGRKPVFVDLGANVGFFTLFLLDALRRTQNYHEFRIKAIEASPNIFRALQSRVLRQTRSSEQVDLYNGLVGRRSGIGTLFEIGYHAMSSTTPRRFSHATLVPFLDFEAICSDVETIDLLKCDIEGAEEDLLVNWESVLQKTKCAVFEFHPQKCNTTRCVELLERSGFGHREMLRADNASSVELFWK